MFLLAGYSIVDAFIYEGTLVPASVGEQITFSQL